MQSSGISKSFSFFTEPEKATTNILQRETVTARTPYKARINTFPFAEFFILGKFKLSVRPSRIPKHFSSLRLFPLRCCFHPSNDERAPTNFFAPPSTLCNVQRIKRFPWLSLEISELRAVQTSSNLTLLSNAAMARCIHDKLSTSSPSKGLRLLSFSATDSSKVFNRERSLEDSSGCLVGELKYCVCAGMAANPPPSGAQPIQMPSMQPNMPIPSASMQPQQMIHSGNNHMPGFAASSFGQTNSGINMSSQISTPAYRV
nr:pre-mRNA-processing protein 40A isoform X1 [Ipomoea batatas]